MMPPTAERVVNQGRASAARVRNLPERTELPLLAAALDKADIPFALAVGRIVADVLPPTRNMFQP